MKLIYNQKLYRVLFKSLPFAVQKVMNRNAKAKLLNRN